MTSEIPDIDQYWQALEAALPKFAPDELLQIPGHNEMQMDQATEHGTMPAEMADIQAPFRAVALDVAGMTCEGCATTAQLAVKRVEGVQEAEFSYEGADGFVTFDPTLTSVEAIIGELDRMTGFSGTVRESSSSKDG